MTKMQAAFELGSRIQHVVSISEVRSISDKTRDDFVMEAVAQRMADACRSGSVSTMRGAHTDMWEAVDLCSEIMLQGWHKEIGKLISILEADPKGGE